MRHASLREWIPPRAIGMSGIEFQSVRHRTLPGSVFAPTGAHGRTARVNGELRHTLQFLDSIYQARNGPHFQHPTQFRALARLRPLYSEEIFPCCGCAVALAYAPRCSMTAATIDYTQVSCAAWIACTSLESCFSSSWKQSWLGVQRKIH